MSENLPRMEQVTKDHKPLKVGEIVFFCRRFASGSSHFEPLLFPVIDSKKKKKKTVSLPVEVPRGS